MYSNTNTKYIVTIVFQFKYVFQIHVFEIVHYRP